jgi:hypothetical protein
MEKMKKIVVTSHIPEDIYEIIREAAFRERISMAELIRKASLEYIENHELKVQGEVDETKKAETNTP